MEKEKVVVISTDYMVSSVLEFVKKVYESEVIVELIVSHDEIKVTGDLIEILSHLSDEEDIAVVVTDLPSVIAAAFSGGEFIVPVAIPVLENGQRIGLNYNYYPLQE